METSSQKIESRRISLVHTRQVSPNSSLRSPKTSQITAQNRNESDQDFSSEFQQINYKHPHKIISDQMLQSPEKLQKLPLLQRRSPRFQLTELQINTRKDFINSIGKQKLASPRHQQEENASWERSSGKSSSVKSEQNFNPPSPMPILSKHQKVQIEPEALWKQRRIRNQTNNRIKLEENSDALEEGTSPDIKKERRQKILQAQMELMNDADSITLNQIMPIQTSLYPKLFQYKVYECYKPQNLKSAREYISYLTQENCQRSLELETYLNQRLDTQFPSFVDQNKLLQFDSNFESGNLDSAYLIGENKYSLLLKVDTNTKGGSHWFYFKVLNWRAGQKVEFQIMNIVRNLKSFYSKGMKIFTKTENFKGTEQTEWIASDQIIEIVSTSHKNPVVRKYNTATDPPTPQSYYNTLTFKCTFPDLVSQSTQKQYAHSVFCFAYALPYGFTDLNKDIKQAQDHLVEAGGVITYFQDQEFNFRDPQIEISNTKIPGQTHNKVQQYVYENNVNQNLTKLEQQVIQTQTQEEIVQQQRLISQLRNFQRLEINTNLLIF